MFRNLIMPCAPRSQGEKSDWTRCCLFAAGYSQAGHPGALCYAQKSWGSFQHPIKRCLLQEGLLIAPAGCISASPESSAPCLDLSGGTSPFVPLQDVCIYPCCSFSANLWALKNEATTVQRLEENTMVLNGSEGLTATPSGLHRFVHSSVRTFMQHKAALDFLLVCFPLPYMHVLRRENMYYLIHLGNPSDQNRVWATEDIC